MKPLARKDLNIQEIESIHQSYLLDSLDWQGDKTINLSEDTKVLLSAMLFDHGDGGFFLFRFDNKDFGDYASRLQEQECAVLVWMSVL